MAIKTVQHFDAATPLPLAPNFDRFAHPHEYTRAKLMEFVERGELPRFRGPETQIIINDDQSYTVIMEWKSRAVAQEYADFTLSFSDPSGTKFMRSIEIVED